MTAKSKAVGLHVFVIIVIPSAAQSRDCAFKNVYNKPSTGNNDTFAVALLDDTPDN